MKRNAIWHVGGEEKELAEHFASCGITTEERMGTGLWKEMPLLEMVNASVPEIIRCGIDYAGKRDKELHLYLLSKGKTVRIDEQNFREILATNSSDVNVFLFFDKELASPRSPAIGVFPRPNTSTPLA